MNVNSNISFNCHPKINFWCLIFWGTHNQTNLKKKKILGGCENEIFSVMMILWCAPRVPRALTCKPALIKSALALLHLLVSDSELPSSTSSGGQASLNQPVRIKRSGYRQNAQSAVILKDVGHVARKLLSYRLLSPGSKTDRLSPGMRSVSNTDITAAPPTQQQLRPCKWARYRSAAPLQDVFYPLDLFLPELVMQIQSDSFTGKPEKDFLSKSNLLLFPGNIPAWHIFRKLSSWGAFPGFLLSFSGTPRGAHYTTTPIKWWMWCMDQRDHMSGRTYYGYRTALRLMCHE